MNALDLLLAAAIFWAAFWAFLIVPGALLLRYSDRIAAIVDAALGGSRHLDADRRQFGAEVRALGNGQLHAIGGGRRHLHAVPDRHDGDAA